MLLMKVVLLIWYSNKNFGFRKIESYLASKIDFEIWKCPIFASSASNCLTRYKQILSGCSLGCKNALNLTCLPMKFHNRVHTSAHYSCTSAKALSGWCKVPGLQLRNYQLTWEGIWSYPSRLFRDINNKIPGIMAKQLVRTTAWAESNWGKATKARRARPMTCSVSIMKTNMKLVIGGMW